MCNEAFQFADNCCNQETTENVEVCAKEAISTQKRDPIDRKQKQWEKSTVNFLINDHTITSQPVIKWQEVMITAK